MELLNLDSNFQPTTLVENYESLIWTERYSKAGDFQLKSSNIAETLAALPDESFVTLRESTVPMMVEYSKIEKSSKGPPVVTVVGRSFEAPALERRGSVRNTPPAPRTAWLEPAAKESDAAYKAIREVIGDTARYQGGTLVLGVQAPSVSPLDAIPEIDLILPADYGVVNWNSLITYDAGEVVYYSDGLYSATGLAGNLNKTPLTEPTYWTALPAPGFWSSLISYNPNTLVVDSGILYISSGLAGNLNQVPASSPTYWYPAATSKTYEIKPGELYTMVMELIATNNHGIKSIRPGSGGTQVGIEIYNGADLTNDVVVDARFDQFNDATYLLGKQGSKNVAYVYGSGASDKVLKTAAPEPSGLERRVLVIDESSDASTASTDVRKTRGLIELYKYNATALFDGEVAQQIAAGYTNDYFLGDIIKLTGEYGLSQNVRVAEFIRASDASGQKAYPAFEAVV